MIFCSKTCQKPSEMHKNQCSIEAKFTIIGTIIGLGPLLKYSSFRLQDLHPGSGALPKEPKKFQTYADPMT